MSGSDFHIDRRDIDFVLFEHLRVQDDFEATGRAGLSRSDVAAVLDEGHRLAREVIFPTRVAADRQGCRFKDGAVAVPESFRRAYQTYAEGGWIALSAPESIGGANVPVPIAMGCGEVFVAANLAFGMYPGLSRGVARVLEKRGDDRQREAARKIYSGEWTGTMCLTEPHAGTAVGDLKTTATPTAGGYRIKGTKCFITAGEHDLTPNIIHLVLARTPDAPKGIKGLSLFMVPKIAINPDGTLGRRNDVVCTGIEEKMGIHGSATCTLSFGENERCEGTIIGKEGEGIAVMFQLMNEARIGTGVQGLASGAAAYGLALAYARERIQGTALENLRDASAPRVPILEHPDVRRMMFSMKSLVEGMRALLYHASQLADRAANHRDEAQRTASLKRLELLTPICKAYCSDQGFAVTVTAMQVFGGTGYVRESGVEQLLRDVKIASIYEGTNGVQALDLVGRKLGSDRGQNFLALLEEIGVTAATAARHPTLGELGERLEQERQRAQVCALRLAQAGMSGDVAGPALAATPLLNLLGNLVVGWLLVQQALLAHDRLAEALLDAQVTEAAERQRLLERDPAAAYLDGKIHTARFFVHHVLVQNQGLADEIQNGYRGVLAAVV